MNKIGNIIIACLTTLAHVSLFAEAVAAIDLSQIPKEIDLSVIKEGMYNKVGGKYFAEYILLDANHIAVTLRNNGYPDAVSSMERTDKDGAVVLKAIVRDCDLYLIEGVQVEGETDEEVERILRSIAFKENMPYSWGKEIEIRDVILNEDKLKEFTYERKLSKEKRTFSFFFRKIIKE